MSNNWPGLRARPVGRRALLRGGIAMAAGAVGAGFLACGSSGGSNSGKSSNPAAANATATATPQRGGTVSVGAPSLQNFASLAVRQGVSQGAGIIMSNHYQQALLNIDNDIKLSPAVVAKWEIPDPVTYVFTLRDGVQFHDGSPVDAEAAKWSLDRNNKKNPKFPPGEAVPLVLPDRIEAVDAKTVKLTMPRQYPATLFFMSKFGMGVGLLSQRAHATADDPYGYTGAAIEKPITAAPFKVKEFTQKRSIALSRFDGYFGGPSFLDEISYRPVSEDSTRVTLIKTGEAEIISNVPPQDVQDLQNDRNITVDSRPGAKVLEIKANMRKPPFGPGLDPKAIKFRQAILYAIDRKAIVDKLLSKQGSVADSPIAPFQFGYAKTQEYPYDPAKAKQLLAEAGWNPSYKPVIVVGEGFATAWREIAQAIQANLRAVGMDAQLDIYGDYGASVDVTYSSDPGQVAKWDLNYSAWSMTPEPVERLPSIIRSKDDPKINSIFFNSPSMDALLDKQLYSADQEERKRLLAEIQKVCMDQLPYIPLYYQYYTSAWRKKLQGVRVENTESYDLNQAWISR